MGKYQWANQFQELPNQSKFHEKVRLIFTTDSWFKNLSCYQEVFVQDLVPEYDNHQHRFDWYIKELNAIIELHGQQHYTPVNFGNMSYERTNQAFKDGQKRDQRKKDAAEAAGIKYLSVSIETKKLDADYLKTLLFKRDYEI